MLSPSAIFAEANSAERAGEHAKAVTYWRLAGATAGYFPEYCQLLRQNIARVPSGSDTEGYLRYLTPKEGMYAQELTKLKSAQWPEGLAEAIAATEQQTQGCMARLSVVDSLPLVSVIMPTYNRATVITQAISTVLQQYYGHFELLVCDDASTDDTEVRVKAINDKRVRYLKLPKGGAAAARNAGLAQAQGQVIAYLDSDNFWHPAFLVQMLDKLLFTIDCHAVYCHFIDYKVLASAPPSQANAAELVVRPFRQPSFCYQQLQQRNFIDLNCYVHWQYLYQLHGGFNPQLTRRQDYELILRYSWAKAPAHLKQVLALYRRDEQLAPITYQYQHDNSCDLHIATTLAQLKHQKSQSLTPSYLLIADTQHTPAAMQAIACAKLLSKLAKVSVLWLSGPRQRVWPVLPENIQQSKVDLAESHYQLQQPQQWSAELPKHTAVINFSPLTAAVSLSALLLLRQQIVLMSYCNADDNNKLLMQLARCSQAAWPFCSDTLEQQAAVTQTPAALILANQLALACQQQSRSSTLLLEPFINVLTRQWQLHLGANEC
ncbi:hypothetical protein RLON56S_01151 [Alishewanella longhuensis]